MLMRRFCVAAALMLAVACTRPPVTEEVTIDVSGDDEVIVSAETSFAAGVAEGRRAELEAARSAAENGRDAWSVRFSRLTPQLERVTFDKRRGVLESVTRSMSIAPADLQQVFSDTNVTVELVRERRELRFYPGTSSRATREQRLHFDAALEAWSGDAARYLSAMHQLYAYMSRNPDRARYLFAALLNEPSSDGAAPVVMDDEQPLIDAAGSAMDAIAARLDREEESGSTLSEEADLVMNPFPARIVVRLPNQASGIDGFTMAANNTVVIEPVDLFAAVSALEGEWLAPDPMAMLLRDDARQSADVLASMPRRSSPPASAREIESAIRKKLERPATYVVRW